jgi:hypothetical protein
MEGINNIKRYYLTERKVNGIVHEDIHSEYMESDGIEPLEGVTNFIAETIQYELELTIKEKSEITAAIELLNRISDTLDD